MNSIDSILLRLHRRAHSGALLYRFTLATRVLLAVAFIPTGMVKLLGRRFTSMSPEYPIGAFFETLYQSGPYWHFIGLAQVVAGVCVLVPATATIGALMFFPLMLNVFVITISYDFNFTPVITALMLLASVYLLAWDYDRLRPLVGATRLPAGSMPPARARREHHLSRAERLVWTVGTAAALAVTMNDRLGLFARDWHPWLLLIGTLSAFVAVGQGVMKSRSRATTSKTVSSPASARSGS